PPRAVVAPGPFRMLSDADLLLPDALEFRRDRGEIWWQHQRALLVSLEAVCALRQELFATMEPAAAHGVLARVGFVWGFRDAMALKAAAAWTTPEEGLAFASSMQSFGGLAHAELIGLDHNSATGGFGAQVSWQHSSEVDLHLAQLGPATEPVCWTACGYASGFVSACLEREIRFRETACAAVSGPRCIAVARDAAAWARDGQNTGPDDYASVLARLVQSLRDGRSCRHTKPQPAQTDGPEQLRERVQDYAREMGIILVSEAMRDTFDLAARVAPLDTGVLVSGESGTGKELIVRMIHHQSQRAAHPLVCVNCAAITETLLESELFGHVRGAFTDAVRDKRGLFEVATHGTLLLDEVGEMAPAIQAKLLRALQEGEIRRVGSETSICARPRIIAATNRDLRAAVYAGGFREDLYYRLASFVIEVPPLRDHRESIPHMALAFLRSAASRFERDVRVITPEVMRLLVDYPWPGNVRELQHAIDRAVILATGTRITPRELPPDLLHQDGGTPDSPSYDLDRRERDAIEQALARFGGNRRRTAAALNISTVTLWRRMKQYRLHPPGLDHQAG
ncbi:MAG: sigma 54-interacting transcriptional regulator, partial [Vicinamibacterales bacterium]|nr:sigma 54-interacting transcriptional regulator [Vicinamibacterales bacterium]